MPFGHFLLGSQNFMVTALGSCVKWPLAAIRKLDAYTYEPVYSKACRLGQVTYQI